MRFTEIISESAGIRLKDIAKIATNMQDADFWLVRKGSDKTVGKPVKEFDPSRIGVKVVKTDVLDPKYLYYAMMNLHNQGHFARLANGTTNLVNITVNDIANIQLGQQDVAEGLGKDIKRLATGKDVKSRAGQEIAKSQDASMKGDTKTSKKHFDRYDKLDKLANKEQGVAEGTEQQLVTIYTNPAYKGATVDDSIKKSLPVTEAPFNKLQMWENSKSMKDPKVAQWVNNSLLPQLKQNGKLGPLVVWNNKGKLFVIDGNHRFIAYQAAGYNGNVPVQIVPDKMINIVDTVPGQQGVAEASSPAQQAAIAINMKKNHQKPKNEGVAKKSLNELAPSTGGEGDTNYLKTLASAWYNMDWEMLGDLVRQGKNPLDHRMNVQDTIEKMLGRGIHCADGKVRKYLINYNFRFDGVDIQSIDHYEYADHDDAGRDIDSRTGKPWGPYDVIEFDGNELDESIEEGENWSKHNNKRVGGMSKKSVSSYRRSHPGSKIQTAVTTKPSKLKKGSKAAKRRKSFCARMKGMKKSRTSAKTARDPNSNINKSLRRWNCESIEQMEELLMLAEQMVAKARKEIL